MPAKKILKVDTLLKTATARDLIRIRTRGPRFNFKNYHLITILISILVPIMSGRITNFLFTIDDGYIVLKYAKNLAYSGEIYSYSLGEPKTNALTSALWYIIATALVLFLKLLHQDLHLVTLFTLGMESISLLALFDAGKSANKIITALQVHKEIHPREKKASRYRKLTLLLIFSSSGIFMSWSTGLETCLVFALFLRAVYALIANKRKQLFLLTGLLQFARPDVGMSVLVVFLFFSLFSAKINVPRILSIIGIASLPYLLNKIFTGEFLPTSVNRISGQSSGDLTKRFSIFIHALKTTVKNFIHYSSPMISNNVYPAWSKAIIQICLLVISIALGLLILKRILSKIGHLSTFLNNLKRNPTPFQSLSIVMLCGLTVSCLTGANSGEYGRYFVYWYTIFLLLLFSQELLSTFILSGLILLNISSGPFSISEFKDAQGIMSKIIVPTSKFLNANALPENRLLLDSAGYLSLSYPGTVIDVYGLATSRYGKVHGNFIQVYSRIAKENPKYIVAWITEKPTYYLDSAHYANVYGKERLHLLRTFAFRPNGRFLVPTLGVYRLDSK